MYGTAKKGASKIVDKGKRVLQTKVTGAEMPRHLNTRKADVDKPLMAVCDLVDHHHAVLFDSGGSFAMNKKTGVKTAFVRSGKEFHLKLLLEAPEKANSVMAGILAELAEVKAKEEQPQVELTLAGGGGLQSVASSSRFLSGREEPFFRLAVQK